MTGLTLSLLGAAYGLSEIGLSLFKRSQGGTDATDGGSLRVLWITILASMLLGAVAALLLPQFVVPLTSTVQTAGMVIFFSGIVLRWTAIVWLGRFFTVNVAIAVDQVVVDTGPYRWIRHPSYTGALAAFLGFALSTGNWATIFVIMVPITWAFMRRIQIEEAALMTGLGEPYQAYALRTKRLVPLIY